MIDLVIDKENAPKVGGKVILIYKTDINASISSRSINSIVIGILQELNREYPYVVIDGTKFDLMNEGETSTLLKIKE